MAYTTDQLSTITDALTARLNTIDGQNLSLTVQSSIANINARITGFKTDLDQLALAFENQLALMQTALTNLQTQVNNITNPQ